MADSPAVPPSQSCAPSQQKRKRTAITLEVKKRILKDHANGQKVSALVAKYGLSQSTISTIIRFATKITESGMDSGNRKRVRQGAHKDIEDALFEWFLSARAMKMPISGPILAAKAKPFTCMLNESDLEPGGSWLQRFKERHGIVYKAVTGEAASLDVEAKRRWEEETLPSMFEKYADRDI
ncbi:hypothetical protein HPB48_006639 [Haemaphysalis longicornis]|uniref:HTH CENPB-type domain-containing protein n=1 Tax=Haemaphysalis longicornis TaxID=44386 RepID=A0A9J6GXD2_HAELO|nr:hypothetical protein HPB48_006639 [Haemaphysalis longicornis]